MRGSLLVAALVTLAACARPPPVFGGGGARPGYAETMLVETACDMSDRRGTLAELVKQRFPAPWRLIYISEYTTMGDPKVGVLVCFERPLAAR